MQLPDIDNHRNNNNKSPFLRNAVSPINNGGGHYKVELPNQPYTPGGILQRNKPIDDGRPKTPNYLNRNNDNPFAKNDNKRFEIKPIIYADPNK